MEEPVLYDYTGNRPEDVDENTWKRKQQATKLIELETGVPLNELENLEDSESDDDDLEDLAKLEHDINRETLLSFHPETKQINYKELLTLSTITRNKKGIIVDRLHTTLPFLTRYEKYNY